MQPFAPIFFVMLLQAADSVCERLQPPVHCHILPFLHLFGDSHCLSPATRSKKIGILGSVDDQDNNFMAMLNNGLTKPLRVVIKKSYSFEVRTPVKYCIEEV